MGSLPEPPREESESRLSARIPVNERATLLLGHLGSAMPCTLVDVSLDGCRLRTDMETRTGRDVPVEVAFRLGSSSFRLAGRTEWSGNAREIGIYFTEVSPRCETELVEALSQQASNWEAKRAEQDQADRELQAAQERVARLTEEFDATKAREAAARAAVEQAARASREASERLTGAKRDLVAAQKVAERVAAVFAAGSRLTMERPAMNGPLKQPEKAAPAVVAAKTAAQEVPPSRPPVSPKRERRQSERHDVDSTATVFLVDVRSNVQGRILDVSLSGCRIRSTDKFPVGIYRRVEVEFILDGLPFRLPGVVQSLHDPRTTGIRFIDVSERKKEQLSFVIEEIAEASREAEAEPGTAEN